MKKYYSLKILTLVTVLLIASAIFESIFLDKIIVFAQLIALLFLGSKEKAFINPYYLFVLTPFSLLIYVNVIDNYLLDLTHNTYLLANINIMAFTIALWLGPFVKVKRTYGSHVESKRSARAKVFMLLALSLFGYAVPFFQTIF